MNGRVALVTGASKGIGRATAVRLAADGFCIAVNYHADAAGASAVVDAIRRAGGVAEACPADVGDPDQADALVAAVLSRLGRIDVLVSNAAIFPWRDWLAIEIEEWDRVMAVNVRAAFLLARSCYADMRSRGWGRVITLASATAFSGDAHLMHYATSKAAVLGLTRSLARAMGDAGITVNAVSTGKTLTEGLQRWLDDGTLDPEATLRSRATQAIKRIATPEDIVGTISFLASDDSGYMTGQVLNVDGGRNMR